MKALEKAEGRGSNPYYAGNFDGESDELRDLRLSLVAERDALKAENALLEEVNAQLREQNDAVGKACAKYEAELERIKALPPVAWRTFDGEGGYDYRTYDMNESYAEDYAKRNPNHAHWVEPLYALGSKTDE